MRFKTTPLSMETVYRGLIILFLAEFQLQANFVSETGVATPIKIDVHALHIDPYLHESAACFSLFLSPLTWQALANPVHILYRADIASGRWVGL